MASDGRYVYYGNPYPPAPSYEPPRPIRSDSGSSSSQPPQSPAQQHQHYPSQQPYSTPNHNASQSPYPAPSQQHQYSSGPNYMSPVASVPPQQWAQSSWGQQSYPRSDTQNYNPGPPPPIRSSSSEQSQPQRIWPHHTYPPPPPLESPQYPPSPTRSRSDEPQQRSYAPPPRPPPDSPPNTRPVHGHGSGSGAGHAPLPATHPSYHQPQSQVPTFPHRRPPPNTSPPLAADYRRRRRDSSPASAPPPPPPVAVPATVPATAPTVAYPAYSPPTSNAIDFHKLVSSYHTILETGKTITLPRSVDGAMDRMLENASYAAQVLEGASSGSGQSSQSRAHGPARGSPSLASPPVKQHHQQPQLHRIHSASTVSSTSDIARSPSHPQSSARSPPPRTSANIVARAQDPSSRDIKGKIKTTSPMSGKSVGSDVNAHGGSDTVPTAVPSKSQSQKLDDSGYAPAVPDSGSSSTRDPNHRSGSSSSSSGQKCLGCGATATPEWRRGPLGPRTLCNACGLVYAKLVKKRMREAGGSARTAGAYGSRISSSLKEESPEAESDEDDEEQSYDRTQISGR